MAACWSGAALLALQSWRLAAAQHALGWRQALIAVCLLASGLAALQGWRRAPQGRLRWDGAHWFWCEAGAERAGAVAVRLDLQRRVLVRWHAAAGAARWLWLDAEGAEGRWHEVRCALHASSPTPSDPALAPASVPKQ